MGRRAYVHHSGQVTEVWMRWVPPFTPFPYPREGTHSLHKRHAAHGLDRCATSVC